MKTQDMTDGLTATPFELSLVDGETADRTKNRRGVKRNAMKTATYGVMHFCVAVVVAYALTRDIAIALSIGLIEPVVQTFAYTLHELGWSRADKKAGSMSQSSAG